ncbi:MAG: hypothetical protein ACI4Q9_03455 [Candidatus Methanomethylophilaceae archaeon]
MPDYMNRYRRSQRPPRKDTGSVPCAGDVWWATNVDGIKDRPVVVLSFSGGVATCRKCTSRDGSVRDVIEDYYEAGLEKETYLARESILLDRSRLARRLGRLSPDDRASLHI